MSVVHRFTGASLYVGTMILVWWLVAVAAGPGPYATFSAVAGSWIGILILIGYTWALIHHALGGLKYLVLDLGHGWDRAARFAWAKATLAGSVVLTAIAWIAVWLTWS